MMFLSGPSLRLVPYHNEWQLLGNWYYSGNYNDFFRHIPKALSQQDLENYPNIVGGELFLIIDNIGLKPMGMLSLNAEPRNNRACFLGIFIDKEFQGVRATTEATYLALDYTYNRLGYNKVVVEILETNKSLTRTLEATGFTLEGCLLDHCFYEGRFQSELRYSMTASVFKDKSHYLWERVKCHNLSAQQQPQAEQLSEAPLGGQQQAA